MFDPKEEQRYEQLRKLGQQLHIPIPEAFWELEVRDKDGRLIRRHRQRSHSWVRNAYNALFQGLSGQMAKDQTWGAGLLSMKNYAGNIFPLVGEDYFIAFGGDGAGSLPCGTNTLRSNTMLGAAAFDGCGIQVGSGTNAESFEDYILQTQIAHGAGAGQLSYAESEAHSPSYTDTTWKNELVRYFNNNSGGSIDVNEVALMAHVINYIGAGDGSHYLYSRDKLPGTVAVPDTGQLKVTYTVQLTFPA